MVRLVLFNKFHFSGLSFISLHVISIMHQLYFLLHFLRQRQQLFQRRVDGWRSRQLTFMEDMLDSLFVQPDEPIVVKDAV